MIELKGKNILILGAGKSGVSAARFVLTKGPAKVTLSDSKPRAKLDEAALEVEKAGAVLETDGHKDTTVMEADVIVVSPGVPVQEKWREAAARHNKVLAGEVEFAYHFIDAKIIAITGTNGKTTATQLCYDILKDQLGEKVVMGGNIGIPFCDIVREGKKPQYVVLEISSFQLDTIKEFRPYISAILNITDDHLDRYPSMQAYAQSKANIFRNQGEGDFLLLNAGDRFTDIMMSMAKCTKVLFSGNKTLPDGYYAEEGWFVKHVFGKKQKLFKTSEMKLIGRHNHENVLACLMIADILGLDPEKVKNTVVNFKGLAHRIEFVDEVQGRKFYDDSKGTNIDAVIKAVESFEGPMALILGGREKNTDFYQLKNVMPKNVKTVIAFGENREKVEKVFSDILPVVRAEKMEDVIKTALKTGGIDTVLLSPGCASFDMFKSYAHRGDEFKKYVLKAKKGELK
jgi:UDP-N-acetylmuramoylalanine--D-glutamate ligase